MAVLNFFNWLKGANTGVSPFLMDQASCTVLNGANTSYKLGAILKDTGYVIVGSQIEANKSIRGLHNFRQDGSTQKMLVTVDDSTSDDTQLFYGTGGSWTGIGAAETAWANFATMNVEMEDFIGYCFFVGHGTTDGFLPVASLTGTTLSTVTNVTSMPQAKYIKRYRDRIYILNCKSSGTEYPYRVYYSSIPSAGAITWTPATNFLDVDFSEVGTGIGSNWDRLIVFTEYSMYWYDQVSWKRLYDVGCSNNRTIRNSGAYMFWANADGVWVSTGGRPQNIGGEVIDFVRYGNPLNFFAECIDEEYHLYVGTVTVNGVSYANTVLTFSIPTGSWRWRELGHNMTIFGRYNASGVNRLYMGDTTGKVFNKAKYTDATVYSSDGAVSSATDGIAIHSSFETAPLVVEPGKLKSLDTLIAFADRAAGLKLSARVIDKNSRILTPYRPLGTLKDYITKFTVSIENGALIQIQGTEYSRDPYWSFFGFSLDLNEKGELKR